MTELSLGISPCPNDVYIFSGLLTGAVRTEGMAFHVDYQDVETLNARAQAGAMDVVKISYANYIHCQNGYDLLPCGGALGRGVGPLLLSNGGDWDPDGEVLVPGEFTTANFLLDFYAGRPLRKRFLPFDVLYARRLVIHHAHRAARVTLHQVDGALQLVPAADGYGFLAAPRIAASGALQTEAELLEFGRPIRVQQRFLLQPAANIGANGLHFATPYLRDGGRKIGLRTRRLRL